MSEVMSIYFDQGERRRFTRFIVISAPYVHSASTDGCGRKKVYRDIVVVM